MVTDVAIDRLNFVWLELTGRCQLQCSHCYSSSGPHGDHGTMTTTDWRRVIDQAAELGVEMVQFIGGEPTLHPELPNLIRYALRLGVEVEVYSNLMRVTHELWEVFSLPGMRLATSYYSADANRHNAITGNRSHDRTLANIREVVRRGIPLRAAVVEIDPNQDKARAVEELRVLGVGRVGGDRLRQVGRGTRDREPSVDELCGKCANGMLAVTPSGDVLPCVFARWLVLGNVHGADLPDINSAAALTRSELRSHFSAVGSRCDPPCDPQCDPKCEPNCCPNKDGPFPGCPPTDPKRK